MKGSAANLIRGVIELSIAAVLLGIFRFALYPADFSGRDGWLITVVVLSIPLLIGALLNFTVYAVIKTRAYLKDKRSMKNDKKDK